MASYSYFLNENSKILSVNYSHRKSNDKKKVFVVVYKKIVFILKYKFLLIFKAKMIIINPFKNLFISRLLPINSF